MQQSTIIVIVIFSAIIILKYLISKQKSKYVTEQKTRTKIKPEYKYSRKKDFITPSEKEFYKILTEVVADRYYIFPQIHLSALFKNETYGRYHKLAFQIINRMSVDYVLCDKVTFEPVYAVELDDPSHDLADRKSRDDKLDLIFEQNNIPLIRFRDYRNLSLDDIAKRFFEAHNT